MVFSVRILFIFLLFLLLVPSVNASTIFNDNFTALDGTSLASYNSKYTPVQTDNAVVEGNQLVGHASPYYYNDFNISEDQSLSYNIFSDLSASVAYEQWVRHSNDANLETKLVINPNGSGELDYWNSLAWTILITFPVGEFSNSTTYNLKTTVINHTITYYINNISISVANVPITVSQGNFGFNLYNNNNYFDGSINIKIDNLVFQAITENTLNVPLLKQTSNPWQSQIYDSADKWNPSVPTIKTWGCAITSAAMVFNYYGVNKLPDGTNLNPGTLNSWLKGQPDGYIGQGLVNWLALSRLSKKAKTINNLTFDALEYTRTNGAISQLINDINSGIPDILKEPGHYVVAKGIENNTFEINDPYYNKNTLNDGYNNSFQNVGTFKKSNTDLSYIMLTLNPSVDLNVTDSNNQTIGEGFTDSIDNPEDLSESNSLLKIYFIPKPADGIYNITLSSSNFTKYSLGVYLYDKDGKVNIQTITGSVGGNKEIHYKINYINKFLLDLNKFFSDGAIDNSGILNSLIVKNNSKGELINLINELRAQAGKHINLDVYTTLLNDLGL